MPTFLVALATIGLLSLLLFPRLLAMASPRGRLIAQFLSALSALAIGVPIGLSILLSIR